MSERIDTRLNEEGESNPDLVKNLIEHVNDLFTPAADGAGKWLQGKGEQELAKAAEIKAGMMAMLAQVDNERQRLIHERDSARESAENERERDQLAHQQKMHELETRRLETMAAALVKVTEAIKNLNDIGVQVSLEQASAMLAGTSPPRLDQDASE